MNVKTYIEQQLRFRPRTVEQIQTRKDVVEDFRWRLQQGWPRTRATLAVAKERVTFANLAHRIYSASFSRGAQK